MGKPNKKLSASPVNRREFLQGAASFSAMMAMMGGAPLFAAETSSGGEHATQYSTVEAPVNLAVIGCGAQGREILQTLARLPNAPVVAICDEYEGALGRAKEAAPAAETYTDFRALFGKKEVQAVVVATPSHRHREIVVAALEAGKHVYCEAPLAANSEDARAIAQAAKAAVKVNFQSGLQLRSDPQRQFLIPFVRSGAQGKNVLARSQWHKKQSWRRPAASPERAKSLNWRLDPTTSPGLLGELVIHQLDQIAWLLNAHPVAVSGWGSVLSWKDGREVADTVQAVFEFPEGLNYVADAALTTSFDAAHELLYGTDASVMLRVTADEGCRGWMFKEVDAPLLGWEVYARKEQFFQETGIALVADASKVQKALKPGATPPLPLSPLHHALVAFVANSGLVARSVEDFTGNFGDDATALAEYLGTLTKSRRPAAGWREGFNATMLVLEANAAVMKGPGNRVLVSSQLLEI